MKKNRKNDEKWIGNDRNESDWSWKSEGGQPFCSSKVHIFDNNNPNDQLQGNDLKSEEKTSSTVRPFPRAKQKQLDGPHVNFCEAVYSLLQSYVSCKWNV